MNEAQSADKRQVLFRRISEVPSQQKQMGWRLISNPGETHMIGVTRLELATTRPPDEHSTTELHPVIRLEAGSKRAILYPDLRSGCK